MLEALAASLEARAQTKTLRTEVTIADGLPDLLVGDPVGCALRWKICSIMR